MAINLNKYDFSLPKESIALYPKRDRASARMLVSDGFHVFDSKVSDISNYLNSGDLMIFNDSRVIPARLNGVRVSRSTFDKGPNVSATLLNEVSEGTWSALLKPKKKFRDGDVIKFSKSNVSEELLARFKDSEERTSLLEFNLTKKILLAKLYKIGNMPIPPYVEKVRGIQDSDFFSYQSTFAKEDGAVAAPTASLHFNESIFKSLKCNGIRFAFVTLHVGAGTFLPVTKEQLFKRKLHREYGNVSIGVASLVNETLLNGKKVVAVGTTALRLLESAANSEGHLQAFNSYTELMISPGYTFKICDALLTNFHLPKSSLLMLVSAFHGYERVKSLYEHAIRKKYRFYSYGDCMLLSNCK